MAEIEGEKKYSPPRDWTKSIKSVVCPVGLLGSKPVTLRGCPTLAPIIGSNPGETFFPKTKLDGYRS